MRMFTTMFLLAVLAGCSNEAPQVSVRRIEVDGDNARYVGRRLVYDLRLRGVKVTESAEAAPILKATSVVKKFENGVSVFTLEITDGKGLNIKQTVSTQDLPPLSSDMYIIRGVDQVADSLVLQLRPKETTPASPPAQPVNKEKEHFKTS